MMLTLYCICLVLDQKNCHNREATIEAHKKNAKAMTKEKALEMIEQLVARAVRTFNLEFNPVDRDILLSSTMTVYRALG